MFLVRAKDLRTTSQGNMYIHAVLVDRTGQLVARGLAGFARRCSRRSPRGGFVRLKGRVENYKGNPQFIIDGCSTRRTGFV